MRTNTNINKKELQKLIFGRTSDGECCVKCGTTNIQTENFRDDLSRKEFNISQLCQVCQDEIFHEPKGED